MARILVIEDEADIQEVLDYNLRQGGHKVTVASTGRDGLRLARESKPDLVLLDRMLPDLAGTDVCRALKQDPNLRDAHVVFLTAKGEEIDRVVGFELGADDYVVKPFSVRELMLRISAILRRTPAEPEPRTVVELGSLKVDRGAHRVWVDKKEVVLTVLEFRLLLTLVDRRGRVQSRDALLQDVWGAEMDSTTRTVDTHVKRLREKLGSAAAHIETIRGVGYQFAETPA
jgi:two-component system phosphate regulon response regulator PhoB